MAVTFTPGVPTDSNKAKDRFRKMQEATAKLSTAVSVDLSEESRNMADIVESVRTNYGANKTTKKITEDLRTGPADPSAQKNVKPMKCTQCQYHGAPAHDGKCKECGEPMVSMTSSNEDFPPGKNDGSGGDAPMPPPDVQMPPVGGDPGMGAPPPGMPGGAMPPGEPDDGSDDDFDPTDSPTPEVGEMVAYVLASPGSPGSIYGRAGRVMLVFRGEAVIDTGYKNQKGETITDRIPVPLLQRVPESLLLHDHRSATVAATDEQRGARTHPEMVIASRSKSRAQKMIDQVAAGRRTADQAVKAMLS